VNRPLRKLATKFLDLSILILGLCLNVYLSLEKVRIVVSIEEVHRCSVLYELLYQFSHFPVSKEHLKLPKQKNGGVVIDGPPKGSMNGPGGHSWSRAYRRCT